MTDPAELAPTRNPAAYARRPLLTGGFWVMMVFCGLCLLAAAAVVVLGPRLAPVKRATSVTAAPTAMAAQPPAAAPILPPAPPTTASAASDLTGRVQRLESAQARALNAASEAIATSALSEAAARPTPFAADLSAVARVLPASPDAMALAALAQQGAPTRAALATQLAELAGEVSTAARAPGKDASFMDRAYYAFSRVVSVRRVDAHATGADAVLARAEHAAGDGDLEGAVALLDTLPESARDRLAPWREKALRRIEIDRRIAALRTQAIANLAQAQQGAS
ncbi:MAG TPA: hypothetical protein VGI30_07880 [Caulobacteraceae bacterium]|jgi:hypothetical protein